MSDNDTEWVVDTAASYHATPRKEFFSMYQAGDFGTVKMGNSSFSKIVGIGDVRIQTKVGCTMVLKDVRHVPDLRLNLISGIALGRQGYENYFGKGMWKLKKGSLVVARGQASGTLYKTHVEVHSDSLNATEDEASPNLWHKRLGHMSEKGLQIMAKKSLIPFAKDTKLNPCDSCLFGKQHRVAFHSSSRRQSELLSRVYSDVCGLIEVKSLGGRKYFLTFIDDASQKSERMNWTIVEKVRCMLKMAKLPKPFWGEAVRVACYLINRSPSVPLNFEIPEKVWSGREISYSHLRVFGCKVFAHVSKEHRQKLDDKATPCIFIGYGDEEFGYRLWDPKNKKVIRSRDVAFQEGQTLEDFGQPTKSKVNDVLEIVPNPAPSQHATNEEELPQHATNDVELQDGFLEEEDPEEKGFKQGEPQPPPPEAVGPQLRISTRESKLSSKYPTSDYILLTDERELESFQEAQNHKEKSSWHLAMQEEMQSLQKNQTYDLIKLPQDRKPLQNKWVFKLKKDGSGKLVKYKARLVVKGFRQKKGMDFDEIFSPVVKMTSIRVVLGLAASLNLELEQMDVKTTFLHGDLKEEIHMEQLEGFEIKGKENLVCRLKKSLYGLKQAPRQWYEKFDSFMVGHEYKRTATNQCVYVRKFPDGNFIILLLYVDDMLIVGQDATVIRSLKNELSQSFDMKDLGPAQQMLGIQIVRDRKAKKLWLSQEKYVERVIAKFNMKDSKPVNTPLANHFKLSKSSCPSSTKEREEMEAIPYLSVVESLMYVMVSTRPDITHAVGVVSRFLSNPGKEHWEAVKWILRYLKGTTKMCLCFRNAKPVLEGYTDSDMAGDLDGSKSTSGFLFTFAGGAVSWQSKLQNYVALSTTEAEYITAAEAGKEMLWLQRFLQELGLKQEKFMVHCDSQSAIDLSKNSMYHSRTKHINIQYHWIREVMERQIYRGKLTDGGEIAVKKPLVISEKGKELVMNEMKLLLGSAHHRNIEFASNGSLDYLLFNSETCRADTLDWKRTYAIIIGVARGLLYLHERSHNVIIHCDIKPTNILIDENWVPKIADFGMANLFPQDQTHANINEATVSGYLAPEYMDNGHVSPKADTYSFGVVVLELISSRKNWNSHNQSPNGQGLWDTANELCKEVKVSEFMDLKLIPSAILDQVQLCVKIGVLCTEFDLELRPTMDPAYSMLLENRSSSNTLVNEPMTDGSSSSSSTA
ncbi:unnamed protein product [Camellia sinensis]